MHHRIVFFGPQGSGKGTQAQILSEKLKIPIVNTGPVFRKNISEGTELGVLAASYINKGHLAPDAVTINMIKERLRQKDVSSGFILDGFPRTVAQFDALLKMAPVDAVVVLGLSDSQAIARIAGRRECDNRHGYHVEYHPPKVEGVCDIDGSPLQQREDDQEDAIRKRLEIYHRDTEPLIERFERASVPVEHIDAAPPIADVAASVASALEL